MASLVPSLFVYEYIEPRSNRNITFFLFMFFSIPWGKTPKRLFYIHLVVGTTVTFMWYYYIGIKTTLLWSSSPFNLDNINVIGILYFIHMHEIPRLSVARPHPLSKYCWLRKRKDWRSSLKENPIATTTEPLLYFPLLTN